jgi:hypothetical protein
MYAVKNSFRALIVAVIPLGVIHAVLFAMLLLRTQTKPSLLALPSPDRVFALYVVELAIDAALLFAGHMVLRERAVSGRLAYALMGGAMAASSYAIVLHNGLVLAPPDAGSEVTAGLLPTFAGMIAGFLYCQFAGLAPAREWPRFSAEGLITSYTFDGPLRVRTSVAATVLAAAIPACLTALVSFAFFWIFAPPWLMPSGGGLIFLAAIPAQVFLTMLIVTVVPSGIFVVCVHHIARALHRSRGLDYALVGAAMGCLCGVVVAPFTALTAPVPFLLVPALLYGAIMGELYRRFAGLEPEPLPEPVIVTDVDTLVSADHSSRQGHRVVFTD